MNRTELVIMAAGLSSRYNGMKQLDGMDEYGQPIMEYSVYDAMLAGFDGVTLIVGEGMTDSFRRALGDKLARKISVKYVEQKLSDVPDPALIPSDRKRPWGTAHAILCCRSVVDRPFLTINSDDFYGRQAFVAMHRFLSETDPRGSDWAMAEYLLKNTVPGDRLVSRAACKINNGYLKHLKELKVRKTDDGYEYSHGNEFVRLDENTVVSMNMWGLTPAVFDKLGAEFDSFFAASHNTESDELNIGDVISDAVGEQTASVKVIPSDSSWFGVTYSTDKDEVSKRFSRLRANGEYPDLLF